MNTINFVKMVGTGNDFIVIDNRKGVFQVSEKIVQTMCDRRSGIGSDGIILIENSSTHDFKMRIINPDGSEVDMCGNGARCAVQYAHQLNLIKRTGLVETLAGTLKAEVEKDQIFLNMGIPKDYRFNFQLKYHNKDYNVCFLNTGVPHVVIFVDKIDNVDVKTFGSFVRYHEKFSPKGTNCNFVEVTGVDSIKVRTYERGVEDETFSCGTGTCAAAIIAKIEKGLKNTIISTTQLGEKLKVETNIEKNNLDQEFYLIGPAVTTFTGVYQH